MRRSPMEDNFRPAKSMQRCAAKRKVRRGDGVTLVQLRACQDQLNPCIQIYERNISCQRSFVSSFEVLLEATRLVLLVEFSRGKHEQTICFARLHKDCV